MPLIQPPDSEPVLQVWAAKGCANSHGQRTILHIVGDVVLVIC